VAVASCCSGKNLLKALLGEQLQLPPKVWHRLNFAWIAFFGLMGMLNLWVAYSFSTDTWVNFKLFGGIGLMLLFTLAQGFLARYLEQARRAQARRNERLTRECGGARSKPTCARSCSPSSKCATTATCTPAMPAPAKAAISACASSAGASTVCHRVARHRLVYDALRPLAPQGIHALAIEALAPGEAEAGHLPRP
jgi:hypothetical protein